MVSLVRVGYRYQNPLSDRIGQVAKIIRTKRRLMVARTWKYSPS